MLKLTVRRRIVLFLFIVSLVPLVIANGIWLLTTQSQLRKDAATQQRLLVENSADSVNSFISNIINAAIIHAQTPAVQNSRLAEAQAELTAFLKQEPDLTRVALVDANGVQRLSVTPQGASTQAVDVSGSDAYRVVTFLGGEEYISSVSFDARHNGTVDISVPITPNITVQDGTLSTSVPGEIVSQSGIKGALVLRVDLNQLWSSVLSAKLGRSGYAYITDEQGNLIAYPHANFARRHTDLAGTQEVKEALSETVQPGSAPPQPQPHQTVSETGVTVLSSHYRIARTGWIIVAEEPVSSVYAPVHDAVRIAATFFAVSLLVGVLLIVLLSRSLVRPIRELSDGANNLAKGDLGYRIKLSRSDEFGLLASTFNNMAAKISADIAELEDLDKLKNEFIMLASHNLRTPLSVIGGYIGIMREEDTSAERREMVDAIDTSTRQLLAFSEDLITIASIEAGSAKLHVTSLTAGDLLAPLEPEFDSLAAEKDITLSWSIADPKATVTLSPVHIRSAVSNLLRNAIEFTSRGGTVKVSLDIDNEQVRIRVSDDGSGIEADEVRHLFTKFHRGTSTLRYDHPGIGIGLYLTLLIIEAHHGRITVRSQVGHGSTFTLFIPAH